MNRDQRPGRTGTYVAAFRNGGLVVQVVIQIL